MTQIAYSELTKRFYFLPAKGKKVDITDDVIEAAKFLNKHPTEPQEDEGKEAAALVARLKELHPFHISPYNLGDNGEISRIIEQLHNIYKTEKNG